MVFCSMIFVWIFLPATVTVYYLSKKAWRNAILLFVSLLFYAWGEPVYIFLMLTSIGINYVAGILIEKGDHVKEILMIAAILDFGILGYYKYFNFLISTVNRIFRLNISSREIALPIGISFFTFQAFSYVVDVYRKECKAEKNIVNMALYISFFPQLIAGPIVKYSDINMQIKRRNESMENIADGVRRFCYGLGKKVIVANILAEVVDKIAMMDIVNVTGIMAWIVMVFYSLQIYYDFSGYSDMAIGLAGIFGFRIKENFNYPYLSGSIREFWRRWHISLSTWFREYVYIPLGGNREGGGKTYRNLLVIFFLTGLWHGASWNYILWGIYHGFFMLIEKMGFDEFLKKRKFFSHIYTLLVVGFGWILFRFENLYVAARYLKRILLPWKYLHSSFSIWEIVNHRACLLAVIGIFGSGIMQQIIKRKPFLQDMKYGKWEVTGCALIVLLSFSLLAGNTYNPFIYFRF